MHVSSLPMVVSWNSGPAEIRTRDILGRERTLYRFTVNDIVCFHL